MGSWSRRGKTGAVTACSAAAAAAVAETAVREGSEPMTEVTAEDK